ncbi:hypothetical protein HK102_011799 [Quaeritorhiza haematococci]|nr:hypothetical protein HK102_011799 [Quaeritorhiza haematococci]
MKPRHPPCKPLRTILLILLGVTTLTITSLNLSHHLRRLFFPPSSLVHTTTDRHNQRPSSSDKNKNAQDDSIPTEILDLIGRWLEKPDLDFQKERRQKEVLREALRSQEKEKQERKKGGADGMPMMVVGMRKKKKVHERKEEG